MSEPQNFSASNGTMLERHRIAELQKEGKKEGRKEGRKERKKERKKGNPPYSFQKTNQAYIHSEVIIRQVGTLSLATKIVFTSSTLV